ncbi:hypothetical protein GIB67_004299 [Kingdonia uniflora]|uniref:Uncharacterized protein n=1 Tax=Kingdonia uniflora TaxID=39325 RepID=A0A7J7MR40_9MAGN|nr:hypothetical protein GIB67_004299 [Kingdonia uniflora]
MVVMTSTTSSSLLLKPKLHFHANLRHYLSSTINNTNTSSCRAATNNGVLSIRSYMDNSKSPTNIVSKIIGSLPIIGLVARILSDEGGVGDDIVDFAEFRRRVGKKCTVMDSRAFYEFQERRGKPGEPLYVLLCCWLAAVGVGLLKSEELIEGVARLRISNDIEFEEETFLAIMNEAKEVGLVYAF